MPKIETIAILIPVLLLSRSLCQDIVSDGCLEFTAGECARCSRETHLYEGICYSNILGCLEYRDGAFCARCQAGLFQLDGGNCKLLATSTSTAILRSSLYKYSGTPNEGNPGDQYGQSSFIPSSYEQVKQWTTFQSLDGYIRNGEYGHYISRMSNPVFSVHYYIREGVYSYKLLYYGSGGGLFLCIADIPSSLKVTLRSLTPISASNIVFNCFDYDLNGRCTGCRPGNHLENGLCYANYGGCLRYVQNLCLECMDFYLLVENRCVSDCYSASDARSVLYYEGGRSSTMERFYGISISTFYTVTTAVTTTTTFTRNIVQGPTQSTVIRTSTPVSNISTIMASSSSAPSSSTFKIANSSIISNNRTTSAATTSSNIGNATSTRTVSVEKITTVPTYQYQIIIQPNDTSIKTNLTNIPALRDIDLLTSIQKLAPSPTTSPTTSTTTSTTISSTNSSQQGPDQNCLSYTGRLCSKCIQYYFVNQMGQCEELSPLCVSVDPSGRCAKCFSGYFLDKGRCNFKISA